MSQTNKPSYNQGRKKTTWTLSQTNKPTYNKGRKKLCQVKVHSVINLINNTHLNMHY